LKPGLSLGLSHRVEAANGGLGTLMQDVAVEPPVGVVVAALLPVDQPQLGRNVLVVETALSARPAGPTCQTVQVPQQSGTGIVGAGTVGEPLAGHLERARPHAAVGAVG